MFTPAPDLNRIPAAPENLVAVIASINTPNVVLPNAEAEPTQAYILGVRNPDASFSIYIYLLQTLTKRPAIYCSEPRSIPLAQFPEIESEALQFVESMGFMLDNLNFRRQSPDDQISTYKRLPCFKDPSEFAPAADANAPGANLDGLEGLDDLEELAPIIGQSTFDDDLPLVPASLDLGPGALAHSGDALLGALSQPSSGLNGHGPSPSEREKLAALLAAF